MCVLCTGCGNIKSQGLSLTKPEQKKPLKFDVYTVDRVGSRVYDANGEEITDQLSEERRKEIAQLHFSDNEMPARSIVIERTGGISPSFKVNGQHPLGIVSWSSKAHVTSIIRPGDPAKSVVIEAFDVTDEGELIKVVNFRKGDPHLSCRQYSFGYTVSYRIEQPEPNTTYSLNVSEKVNANDKMPGFSAWSNHPDGTLDVSTQFKDPKMLNWEFSVWKRTSYPKGRFKLKLPAPQVKFKESDKPQVLSLAYSSSNTSDIQRFVSFGLEGEIFERDCFDHESTYNSVPNSAFISALVYVPFGKHMQFKMLGAKDTDITEISSESENRLVWIRGFLPNEAREMKIEVEEILEPSDDLRLVYSKDKNPFGIQWSQVIPADARVTPQLEIKSSIPPPYYSDCIVVTNKQTTRRSFVSPQSLNFEMDSKPGEKLERIYLRTHPVRNLPDLTVPLTNPGQ